MWGQQPPAALPSRKPSAGDRARTAGQEAGGPHGLARRGNSPGLCPCLTPPAAHGLPTLPCASCPPRPPSGWGLHAARGHGSPAAWMHLPCPRARGWHRPNIADCTPPTAPAPQAQPGPRPRGCRAQCPPTSDEALAGENPGSAAPGAQPDVIHASHTSPAPRRCSNPASRLVLPSSLTLNSPPARAQPSATAPLCPRFPAGSLHPAGVWAAAPGFPRLGCDPPITHGRWQPALPGTWSQAQP